MAISTGVGAFSLAAPVDPAVGLAPRQLRLAFLPDGALVVVYVLFQLFLWNASARLTDTTSELRHVIEMSHDLAATLDPKDVGHRVARHIALVAHADACILSTWDPEADRVVTFGSFPLEAGGELEPLYELADFPATRAVLIDRQPYVVDVGNPAADPAEVEYLKSIGHRTLVMLPLVVRGKSIGIVELSATRADAFSERDVELAAAARARGRGHVRQRPPLPTSSGSLPTATRSRASPTGRASRTASTTPSLGSAAEARTAPPCCSSTSTTSST